MDGEASKQVVLDYLAAQGRGDGETIAALLADDAVAPLQSMPLGRRDARP